MTQPRSLRARVDHWLLTARRLPWNWVWVGRWARKHEETHVDRIALQPLGAPDNEHLLGRYESKDDPRIGAQERDGRATYVHISEPHTMAECPFGHGVVLRARKHDKKEQG